MNALATFFVHDAAGRWPVIAGVALLVAVLMEPWAMFAHRVLWHRPILWGFHKSHHGKKTGRFEKNDLLSATHAPLAIVLIACAVFGLGPTMAGDLLFGLGAGMTAFGVAYFVFHDGMVHGRLPVRFLWKVPLFARWGDAHEEHHRRNAEPYGFFLGPQELGWARRRGESSAVVDDG